jgi:hypothetical protein
MLTEERAAIAYEEATDDCRGPSVRLTSDNARQWQRVKPGEETNPLAESGYEKQPTSVDRVTTPERVRRTDRIRIQPLVLFERPRGRDPVAAM